MKSQEQKVSKRHIKDSFVRFIHDLQDTICQKLERVDGKSVFEEDRWERPGGGGGITRIIRDGGIFEKGGVNTSVVYGKLPGIISERFGVDGDAFFACGISLVLHPFSPMIPTVHANFRYFELQDEKNGAADAWFGGGMDLTPYYLCEEDVRHFHSTLKKACDRFAPELYPEYKRACDDYFYNAHRDEGRGVGGVFFDYLRENERSLHFWKQFTEGVASVFPAAYIPIVQKHVNVTWTKAQKRWQEIRRGRYVEFNLIHDRGTLFGLKTNGRIESILMSLPAVARWEYNHTPRPGSAEAQLVEVLKNPVEWVPA